jgi:hypothetical protein
MVEGRCAGLQCGPDREGCGVSCCFGSLTPAEDHSQGNWIFTSHGKLEKDEQGNIISIKALQYLRFQYARSGLVPDFPNLQFIKGHCIPGDGGGFSCENTDIIWAEQVLWFFIAVDKGTIGYEPPPPPLRFPRDQPQ